MTCDELRVYREKALKSYTYDHPFVTNLNGMLARCDLNR